MSGESLPCSCFLGFACSELVSGELAEASCEVSLDICPRDRRRLGLVKTSEASEDGQATEDEASQKRCHKQCYFIFCRPVLVLRSNQKMIARTTGVRAVNVR